METNGTGISGTSGTKDRTPSNVTRRRVLAGGATGLMSLGVLGGMGSASADTSDHTLVIEPVPVGISRYTFTVQGNLSKSEADGATIDSKATIRGQTAHGSIGDGRDDAYTFDGELIAFHFYGDPISVTLDGEAAHVGQRPDHFLQIKGSGSPTRYTFSVADNLRKSREGGASIDPNDRVFNNQWTATGVVNDGIDAYTFDDEILAFRFDGAPVNVLLDGQPAHVGNRADHLLQIQGVGSNAHYDFSVSEDGLAKTNHVDGSFNPDSADEFDENSASGVVSNGADVFTFEGDLEAFDLDGEANVLLDGQAAHVGQRPDSV